MTLEGGIFQAKNCQVYSKYYCITKLQIEWLDKDKVYSKCQFYPLFATDEIFASGAFIFFAQFLFANPSKVTQVTHVNGLRAVNKAINMKGTIQTKVNFFFVKNDCWAIILKGQSHEIGEPYWWLKQIKWTFWSVAGARLFLNLTTFS